MVRSGEGDCTDSSWYENDGIVNTISQIGPTTGKNGAETIIKYNNQMDVVKESLTLYFDTVMGNPQWQLLDLLKSL